MLYTCLHSRCYRLPVSSGRCVSLYILRIVSITLDTHVTSLDEGNVYEGKENSLMVKVDHQFDFHCSFELSNFPFDNQDCGIQIGSPVEIRNMTRLKPGSLTYRGKNISPWWFSVGRFDYNGA